MFYHFKQFYLFIIIITIIVIINFLCIQKIHYYSNYIYLMLIKNKEKKNIFFNSNFDKSIKQKNKTLIVLKV